MLAAVLRNIFCNATIGTIVEMRTLHHFVLNFPEQLYYVIVWTIHDSGSTPAYSSCYYMYLLAMCYKLDSLHAALDVNLG